MPHLFRILAFVASLAPFIAAPAGAQATAERRFALVIGNSEYKAGRLPTAANDAGLVAETLRTAGFDVAGARDLDQDTLHRSFREFLDKVSAAGPEAVSFIYLAGYGLQFEGENYIVPIDANIARGEDIPIEAIRISDFTRSLAGTAGGVKIVVIDAARQHPFTPAGAPLASGLALVEPDPGMLIAFNTAPGSVAPIENEPYGAYAQALAEMIGTGGLGLDDVFARVRLRVNELTGGVAVPWHTSKIAQPFMFTEPTLDAPPPPQQVATLAQLQSQPIQQFNGDQEAYVAALERDTIDGYQEFIAAYPDSPHVKRVRALIAVRREALFWRRVLSLNTREAYWSYLQNYPQGAHVADCERRLARLAADYDPPPAFVAMAFVDIPPPPPDEVVYLAQPEVVFDDPVFVPPPPVPVFFCPPRPPEFVALPPPPPPIGAFFLPTPVVSFFSGPRPWVRPPSFVVAPPQPPIQRITISNTTIINGRPGGGMRPLSPTLPGAVVTRVNSGALHAPPPAPPAVPAVQRAPVQQHPGGVLGTQVSPPPRVHAVATTPGGGLVPPAGAHRPGGAPPAGATLGVPQGPNMPGGPQRPAGATPGVPQGPNVGTAAAPHGGGLAPADGPHRGLQPPPAPSTAVTTPGLQPPHVATPTPPPAARPTPPPQVARPTPPPQVARPTPLPQVARPTPPPQVARPTPPPQVARPTPPPQMARPTPPPQMARPTPPPQMARPAPPPQMARPAPPPQVMRPAPPPQAARPAPAAPQKCPVGQVCR